MQTYFFVYFFCFSNYCCFFFVPEKLHRIKADLMDIDEGIEMAKSDIFLMEHFCKLCRKPCEFWYICNFFGVSFFIVFSLKKFCCFNFLKYYFFFNIWENFSFFFLPCFFFFFVFIRLISHFLKKLHIPLHQHRLKHRHHRLFFLLTRPLYRFLFCSSFPLPLVF